MNHGLPSRSTAVEDERMKRRDLDCKARGFAPLRLRRDALCPQQKHVKVYGEALTGLRVYAHFKVIRSDLEASNEA
jgi:hypothetical protein